MLGNSVTPLERCLSHLWIESMERVSLVAKRLSAMLKDSLHYLLQRDVLKI